MKHWEEAGRQDVPRVVALAYKPNPDQLTAWAEAGVTDILYGLPDKPEPDVLTYLDRLTEKLTPGSFQSLIISKR